MEGARAVSVLWSSHLGGAPTPIRSAGLAQGRASVDAHILATARADAGEGLAALYHAYKDRVYTFLLRLSGSAEQADDLTHDTFMRAAKALGGLEDGRPLLPWLYRIANNVAIDEFRRRSRFAWLRWPSLHGTNDEPTAPDDHARVGERERVAHAMRQLTPAHAGALLLHSEGYSYKEIAEIQGVSLTAVRSRIARARAAFREAYKAR